MRACCIKYCRSESFRGCGISFYRIPRKEPIRQKWIDAIGYVPKRKDAVVCSSHFRPEELTFSGLRPQVTPDAVPSIFPTEPTAPLIAQPSPGPSQSTDTLDSDASTEELQEPLRQVFSVSNESTKPEDPLRQDTKQCRFCGKYSKDCVPISHTHIASFTTKLAFNDIVVQFNETLPKTVCKDCDVKLQVIYDFVKYAKAAQELLINVEDVEEMVEVKHEYDDETYDRLEDSNSDEEIKDGIVDLFTVGETVYIKENQKRKSIVISGVKLKKAKVTKSETGNESKNMSDTKEVIDRDDTNNEADNDNIGFSSNDTRTNKPNDAKFAKRVFVHKVRIDGNS
ncbi:uncharacterized protein LOC134752948 isoform X2 [Cydia strobilella]|uniref:uncharacterized protein LOC134752948 isoform X2 n=1 Tax=Cydia strobilella TaxID=1100964 RepID=UPI003006BE0C